jgi:glutamate/tyrosine decarboxylase-like PLP-dependent enzyme
LGALSDLLAAAMNPNVTIGEHAPMYVDKQVVEWCKQMLNFPASASGILLSGGSMANITALTVARNHQAHHARENGVFQQTKPLLLYCSSETHSCVIKAAEIIGLGTRAVRIIRTNDDFQMDTAELETTITEDIANGFQPICVVATAGTVNTGAIDPLAAIHDICRKHGIWFHIDGAYGALCKLDPRYARELEVIEEADSVAFDLHKWLYIPYEVGCALFKNAEAHKNSFAITPNYLLQASRGLAAGPESMNNLGFELSRGFKALKVWMSIKEHGLQKYADMITQNNRQAEYLGAKITKNPHLRLLAAVSMSLVCYQFTDHHSGTEETNELNREILIRLQEQGIASPSSTILNNNFCIRVCIVNQRTRKSDLDLLVEHTVRIGNEIVSIQKLPNRG